MLRNDMIEKLLDHTRDVVCQQVLGSGGTILLDSEICSHRYDDDKVLHMVVGYCREVPSVEYRCEHAGSRISISMHIGAEWVHELFVLDLLSDNLIQRKDYGDSVVCKAISLIDNFLCQHDLAVLKNIRSQQDLIKNGFENCKLGKCKKERIKKPWRGFEESYLIP